MGKRQQRHDAIRAALRYKDIRTQRDLVAHLQSQGFACTQATVSRDIADLSLVKDDAGCYALPEELRVRRLVSGLVVHTQTAGNLLVVKTEPGSANSVAQALDQTSLPEVVGTIAGDDTILIITQTPVAAVSVQRNIDRFR